MINYNLRTLPDIGNVIPYDDVMKSLFGNEIKEIPRMELLSKNIVVNVEDETTLFFKLGKLEDYLKLCSKRIDFNNRNICAINYFNIISNLSDIELEVPESQQQMFDLIFGFKEFLESKNDIHSKIIKKLYWNGLFNGVVTSFNQNPFMLTFKFDKKYGLPFIINVSEEHMSLDNTLSLNSSLEVKNIEYERLYNNFVKNILMETPEKYVTYCLENVTGSLDLAKFIFASHNDKVKYIISVEDLNNIINFSNSKKMNSYMDIFKKSYTSHDIFELKGEKIYLNFEGFNKYLLNLDISFLKTFEDKERVNNLYFNVMDELVNSYKKLYDFNKLI